MNTDELESSTGVTFKDKSLLRLAFVHRSYLNESKETNESNERLEFLGDSVLSFLTSKHLYISYPQDPEGTLTNIRSGLVKTRTLADAARKLGLGRYLYLSKGEEESGGRNNTSLLADTFEAFLGAMYLDRGLSVVEKFLGAFLFPEITVIVETKSYVDFKSHLQEIIQEASKTSPTYRVTKSEGPDHDKTFWVEVLSKDTVLGQGKGKSKQEAQQAAAESALEKITKT